MGLPEPSVAARKQDKTRREVLRWLDRSLAAQQEVGTVEARCSIDLGEALDPNTVATRLGMDLLCRRVPEDTVCGFRFALRFDPEEEDEPAVRAVYDGEALYYVEDDSTMIVFPAKQANSSFFFFPEWYDRLHLFRESLVLSDSVFRDRYAGQGWDIGTLTIQADTVIDGRRCKLIRNIRTDTRPKLGVWFRRTEFFALDAETALPVYHRTHFERTQHGKKSTDQVTVERVDSFRTGVSIPDSEFRSPGLPVKTELPLAVVTDTTELRWNGGGDVLGRWPETVFSDSSMLGRVVMIDFSYKGCGFCQLALPVVDSLARVYGVDTRVQFLMIDPVDSPKTVTEYARDKGLTFPVLSVDERFAASFGVNGYPAFVILGPDGKQVFRLPGYPGSNSRLAEILGDELKKLLP